MTGYRSTVRKRLARTAFALVSCALLGIAGAAPGLAQHLPERGLRTEPVSEYLVKAAFLFNFARFAEWPADAFDGPADPVNLCVLGRDPFGAFLQSLKGKRVGDRKIQIRHLIWAEEAAGCHVLFLSQTTEGRLGRLFQLLDGRPVLTVSDWPEPVRSGGVIGLEVVDRKVRFRINVDAAKQSGVKLSSRLLKLAVIVRNSHKSAGESGATQKTSKR